MSMVSAKEFAQWLFERFKNNQQGVYLTRKDISLLTGRTAFSLDFVHDIHHELMPLGMAFATDTTREYFFLQPLAQQYWRHALEEQYQHDFINVLQFDKLEKY
ncbi:MAG: hypothetical protein ACRC53_08985 [Plesiomonas sp.]|uniref:hypothetical protein n=1 Tax=Plesiomonas sp. TaxID=2486279 RepID=UPI003F2A7FB9